LTGGAPVSPALEAGSRGAIKKEYIIRLRLMNLRFPCREAPPCGRGDSQMIKKGQSGKGTEGKQDRLEISGLRSPPIHRRYG